MTQRKYRTLVESHAYSSKAAELGEIHRLDAALRGLLWGIATKPDEFDSLRGENGNLRMAKTDPFGNGTASVPQIRVWFRMIDGSRVELLYLDTTDRD